MKVAGGVSKEREDGLVHVGKTLPYHYGRVDAELREDHDEIKNRPKRAPDIGKRCYQHNLEEWYLPHF